MGEGYYDPVKKQVMLEDNVRGTVEPKPVDRDETHWITSKCRMI
eukprot:CAMPEP_0116941782 /NCGR_PEP_ID=MMETSP0467-20121206/34194_1 /TAXON_ID=283647 /ORGANISM="Mesodinium pulex, Strain SPMC105" /LENGTH=43 /DNA_ID= /DNA_START= /DNA_END= /DNA_ORIENTATION=